MLLPQDELEDRLIYQTVNLHNNKSHWQIHQALVSSDIQYFVKSMHLLEKKCALDLLFCLDISQKCVSRSQSNYQNLILMIQEDEVTLIFIEIRHL